MATSPVPLWAQEMSPHHHGPTAGGVLFLAVVAVLVALLIQLAPATERGQASTTDRGQGVSLCEEHPHWSVCEAVPTASTAHSRRSGLPSPGVVRKKRGRLPGSLWCECSRLDERVRPTGEEKRPANPGRAAINGLAVRVQGRVLGIDPDPSASRPSAAPHAPQAVAR